MGDKRFEKIKARVLEAAGGVGPLASDLGVTRHAIYQWRKVPASRVGQVMELTGMPAHKIRPDLFREQATA